MTDRIKETELLAKSYGLEFKNCGNGHLQLSNHGVLLNYWPNSKGRTAHMPQTGQKQSNCSPWDAVSLCLNAAKSGMRPALLKKKKLSKNKPKVNLGSTKTNPAGIKHLYDGETPPWEFKDFMMAHSDRRRIAALRILQKADAMDNPIANT
ncbi:MAG: hypothetical protein MJA83_10270 [Gammaproteobacteria bacterium]|nr:hypothetical protein [Gammaproteobacteria bacterium]